MHFQAFDFFAVENTCPSRLVYSPFEESIPEVLMCFCGGKYLPFPPGVFSLRGIHVQGVDFF